MKKLFLSLVAAVCAMSSYAQSDLVATLSHGSSITDYYGTNALAEAYTASAEGDVITLSSGEFNVVNIEKAITLRGAGMMPTEQNENKATYLLGNFELIIPEGNASAPTIENVICNGVVQVYGNADLLKANFTKCQFIQPVACWRCNPFFTNCIFKSSFRADRTSNGSSDSGYDTFVNCIGCAFSGGVSAQGIDNYNTKIGKVYLDHCVAKLDINTYGLNRSTFKNCILASTSNSVLPEEASVNNCLCLSYFDTFNDFINVPTTTNIVIHSDGTDIFKTYITTNNTLSIKEDFQLTDEAAAQYLGEDGTQVGIYGGTTSFDPTPSYPLVKKLDVIGTHSNGKLNVKINVE